MTFDRAGNPTGAHRSIVNLNEVRRITKTNNGWARILWAVRVDPLTLDETYESFIDRIRHETWNVPTDD